MCFVFVILSNDIKYMVLVWYYQVGYLDTYFLIPNPPQSSNGGTATSPAYATMTPIEKQV